MVIFGAVDFACAAAEERLLAKSVLFIQFEVCIMRTLFGLVYCDMLAMGGRFQLRCTVGQQLLPKLVPASAGHVSNL